MYFKIFDIFFVLQVPMIYYLSDLHMFILGPFTNWLRIFL